MAEQPATRIDAHFIAAGKYHDIDYARLEVLKLLMEHPHIRTTVAADYSGLERLDQCRFLVTYTCDLLPTKEQAQQLRSWLEAGGKPVWDNWLKKMNDAGHPEAQQILDALLEMGK